MNPQKRTLLIVPGYADSGPDHWQGRWLAAFPDAVKVIQEDWIHINRDAWIDALDAAIEKAAPPVILIGHSLGCSTILEWVHLEAEKPSIRKVKGALLVAPPDPQSSPFRALGIKGFDATPMDRLPFPSILVASENDPFLTIEKAKFFASRWGSRFVSIGKRSHIGDDSGVGDWKEGKTFVKELLSH